MHHFSPVAPTAETGKVFSVTTTTGTGRGAGTSANVWVQLFGSEAQKGTERFPLDQDPLNFEAGRKDTFRLPGKLKVRAPEMKP